MSNSLYEKVEDYIKEKYSSTLRFSRDIENLVDVNICFLITVSSNGRDIPCVVDLKNKTLDPAVTGEVYFKECFSIGDKASDSGNGIILIPLFKEFSRQNFMKFSGRVFDFLNQKDGMLYNDFCEVVFDILYDQRSKSQISLEEFSEKVKDRINSQELIFK